MQEPASGLRGQSLLLCCSVAKQGHREGLGRLLPAQLWEEVEGFLTIHQIKTRKRKTPSPEATWQTDQCQS
jgi:hypothetical protein